MDLRTIATVFAALFLLELGDKSQLAVVAFTAGGRSAWSVFLGATLALVISTGLAILFGQALLQVVPPVVLRLGAAVVFVVVGVLVGYEAVGDLRTGA